MTRPWIIPLMIAVVVGLLAYGITRSSTCVGPVTPVDRLHDVSFLVRELKLSEAQASRIRSLQSGLAASLGDCCGRHCSARAKLGQALADETNAATRTEEVLKEMCRVYEESERATLDHVRRVREVLDVQQRKRFDAMLTSCVCRTCAGCKAP